VFFYNALYIPKSLEWCPLRLRVAWHAETNRNTIGVSISLATQRNAQL